jgi:hypothetical protein
LQFGDTALHYAAFCGHVDVLRALLAGGADPSALAADGRSPLAVAFEEGHHAAAQVIIEAIEARGGSASSAAASLAAAGGTLARSGATSAAVAYASALAALSDASYAGDVRAVYARIQAGADVNGVDAAGFTPLHRAAAGGNTHVLELLLGAGADVNPRDAAGCTPLHYASLCGSTDAAHMLLQAGADSARRSREGVTPVEVASMVHGNTAAISKLLTGTYTRAENLDFSHGVALEGELRAKRSGLGMGLFKWKHKYAVLSKVYRSIFLWTGGPSAVEGAVTRIRLDAIDSILHDSRSGSRKFTVRPRTGDPLELQAAGAEDATAWVAAIKAVMVATQEEDSKEALLRTMMASADGTKQRSRRVALHAAGALPTKLSHDTRQVGTAPQEPPASHALDEPMPSIADATLRTMSSEAQPSAGLMPRLVPRPPAAPREQRSATNGAVVPTSPTSSKASAGPLLGRQEEVAQATPVRSTAEANVPSAIDLSLARVLTLGDAALLPWQQNKTKPDELTAALRRRAGTSVSDRPPSVITSAFEKEKMSIAIQRVVRGHRARRLLRGWIRCVDDENGDIYWYNTLTGKSSWLAPAVTTAQP